MVDYQRVTEVKSATIKNFADLWMDNYNRNRGVISRSPGVSSLFGKFPRVPAIVVGAGPSLDKNKHLLQEAVGKAVIIAVDTILEGVERLGVTPNVTITLDPQQEIERFFMRADTSRKILVAPTIAHPVALSWWKGETVFYNKFAPDISPLVKIASLNQGLGYLIPGGSVLSVGLDLAFRMGANPIAFIGQDLSYPPGAAYSSSAMYGGRDYTDMFSDRMAEFVTDTDIFGRTVHTQKNMSVTKQWMEWAFVNLKRDAPVNFYNCTEGGIVGGNCVIATLAEWIARYCRDKRNLDWEIRKALSKRKR